MATVARRTPSPVAEISSGSDQQPVPHPVRRPQRGLAPFVRVEDYIEDDSYVLQAELPGIDPEKDVEVTVEHDMLTISGERREETKDKNHREFHYGAFKQAVALPASAGGRDHRVVRQQGPPGPRSRWAPRRSPASRSRSTLR